MRARQHASCCLARPAQLLQDPLQAWPVQHLSQQFDGLHCCRLERAKEQAEASSLPRAVQRPTPRCGACLPYATGRAGSMHSVELGWCTSSHQDGE